MPLCTFTVPLLLNCTPMVLVPVPAVFCTVPALSKCAEAPLSAGPKFCVKILLPSPVNDKVAPETFDRTPAAALPALVGFRLMLAFAANVELLPCSSTTLPSSMPIWFVMVALPCTIVWPVPVSLPPDHVIAPLTVTVPEPVSVPKDCVSDPMLAPLLPILSVPLEMLTVLPRFDSAAVPEICCSATDQSRTRDVVGPGNCRRAGAEGHVRGCN